MGGWLEGSRGGCAGMGLVGWVGLVVRVGDSGVGGKRWGWVGCWCCGLVGDVVGSEWGGGVLGVGGCGVVRWVGVHGGGVEGW